MCKFIVDTKCYWLGNPVCKQETAWNSQAYRVKLGIRYILNGKRGIKIGNCACQLALLLRQQSTELNTDGESNNSME